MMKRIMVFLAIGVALAPAAFAQDVRTMPVPAWQTGENSPHEMDNAIAGGASQCKFAQVEKQLGAVVQEGAAVSQAGRAGF
jgi:hypothetical protein